MPLPGLYIGSTNVLVVVLAFPVWAFKILAVKCTAFFIRPSLNFWEAGPLTWCSYIETSISATGHIQGIRLAEHEFAEEVADEVMSRVQAAASEVLMHAYANRRSGHIHIDMSERNSGDSSRAPELPEEEVLDGEHATNDTERARAQFARLRQTISQNEGAQTDQEPEVSYQSIDIPSIMLPSREETTEVLDSLALTAGADPAAPRAILEEVSVVVYHCCTQHRLRYEFSLSHSAVYIYPIQAFWNIVYMHVRMSYTLLVGTKMTEFQICYYFAALLPFVFLFALKAVIDNYGDLIRLLAGFVCFIVCDGYIQAVVAAGRPSFQQRATVTVGLIIGLFATSNTILPVEDYNVWKVLTFQSAGKAYHGFLFTLLIVVLTDNFIKFLTVLAKMVLVMLPCITPHQKRRNFQCTEYLSQFYRCVIPTIQWVYYFLGDNPDSYAIIDIAFSTAYVCLKFREIYTIGMVLWQSIQRVFEVSNYGVTPSQSEVDDAGMCSICHDRLSSPTKLSCSHLFCHSCIDTWLDKEHTCPMCRAVIDKQDNDFKNGATSKLVRFY